RFRAQLNLWCSRPACQQATAMQPGRRTTSSCRTEGVPSCLCSVKSVARNPWWEIKSPAAARPNTWVALVVKSLASAGGNSNQTCNASKLYAMVSCDEFAFAHNACGAEKYKNR